LLDSDNPKVREQTKAELLKNAFVYTRELKTNFNNSSLEIQDTCKEIIKKYYDYSSELMQNHNLPILTKENSQEASIQKFASWIKRNYSSAYQKNGKKNIKWDSTVEKLLVEVCEFYAFKRGSAIDLAEKAKNLIASGCEDLYVTYTYANMCYITQDFENAKKYFLKCEAYLQQGEHPTLFHYFVMNKLLSISTDFDSKAKYANLALLKIAEFFDKTSSQEDINEFASLVLDFSLYTLRKLPYEVLEKLMIPDCKNEIGKIFLAASKIFSGKIRNNKIEYIENLSKSVPKNAESLLVFSKLFTQLFAHLDKEYTLSYSFNVLEKNPDNKEYAFKILDSIVDDRDRHYDLILFGAEYFATYKNAIGAEVFLTSYWQQICSENYYQYFGWHEFLNEAKYKDMVNAAFAEIEKMKNITPYQKSMVGVNAFLQKNFKVALQEIASYQNVEFQYRWHAYISKDKILSEVLPLKYLNSSDLIEFCSAINASPFSEARAQLFLKSYGACKTEKQKFYISRLVRYIRFTNNGEINDSLCQILFDLGFEELIIRNFIDYTVEFKSSPKRVLEFIKTKLDPLTVTLFEISNPWQCQSISDFNELKLKIESKFNELHKDHDFQKNALQSNLLIVKKEIAIARVLFYLIYKNTSMVDETGFSGQINFDNYLQTQEFYEVHYPLNGINRKHLDSFFLGSNSMLSGEGGYIMKSTQRDKTIKTEFVSQIKIPEKFQNEEEAYAFVSMAYKKRLSSLYKLNLYHILMRQGYNEIAEYICVNTFSKYIDLICYDKRFNYYSIRRLFDINGIEKHTNSLLYLTLYLNNMPQGFDLFEVVLYMLQSKEFVKPMYFENIANEQSYYLKNYNNNDSMYIVNGNKFSWQQVISYEIDIVNNETTIGPEQKKNLLRLIEIMKSQMEK